MKGLIHEVLSKDLNVLILILNLFLDLADKYFFISYLLTIHLSAFKLPR